MLSSREKGDDLVCQGWIGGGKGDLGQGGRRKKNGLPMDKETSSYRLFVAGKVRSPSLQKKKKKGKRRKNEEEEATTSPPTRQSSSYFQGKKGTFCGSRGGKGRGKVGETKKGGRKILLAFFKKNYPYSTKERSTWTGRKEKKRREGQP